MRTLLTVALCVGSLSGCISWFQPSPRFTADLTFVQAAGLGYWNDGLLRVGYLYLWDTQANKLTKLSDAIPLTPRRATEPQTTLVSSNVKGVSVEGSFGSTVTKTALSAAVGRQIEFRAENAIREDYSSVYTGLATAYVGGQANGEDLWRRWHVADATRTKSPYYYVVITGVIRADKTLIAQKGLKGDNNIASVSVTVPGVTKPIVVAVESGSSSECTGKAAACFFEATILKPYLNEAKRLDFEPALDANPALLPAALRKL